MQHDMHRRTTNDGVLVPLSRAGENKKSSKSVKVIEWLRMRRCMKKKLKELTRCALKDFMEHENARNAKKDGEEFVSATTI